MPESSDLVERGDVISSSLVTGSCLAPLHGRIRGLCGIGGSGPEEADLVGVWGSDLTKIEADSVAATSMNLGSIIFFEIMN